MRTSSDHVLLKIKLSKCVQSNCSISQSQHVIRFNTKINYKTVGQVLQMFSRHQSRCICFSSHHCRPSLQSSWCWSSPGPGLTWANAPVSEFVCPFLATVLQHHMIFPKIRSEGNENCSSTSRLKKGCCFEGNCDSQG